MININKKLSIILVSLILIVIVIAGKNSFTSGEKIEEKDKELPKPKQNIVSVFLNDKLLEFSNDSIIENDKAYVPVEEFAKAIDADVKLKGSKKITINKDKKSIEINRKENTVITEDGKPESINIIEQDKVAMLPLNFLAEHFGFKVYPIVDKQINVYDEAHDIDEPRLKEKQTETDENITDDKLDVETAIDPDAGKKIAYLTFDDGPNLNTPQILDVLKEKNVKATFFMLGSSIVAHGDIAKRISEEDHGLGVHSMTHDFKSVYASPDAFVNEMNAANDELYKATGKKTTVLRAPYGSKPYMKQEFRDLATSWGYRIWDWNVDSSDSIKKNTTPDEVYNEVANQIVNKDKAVILFHDKEHTLNALPRIIDHLIASGFEIRKLDKDLTPLNFWNDER